jgi:hypothetical protein
VETKPKVVVVVAQIFQLYANLLSNESHQHWEKIVKAHTETAPWMDIKDKLHEERR